MLYAKPVAFTSPYQACWAPTHCSQESSTRRHETVLEAGMTTFDVTAEHRGKVSKR